MRGREAPRAGQFGRSRFAVVYGATRSEFAGEVRPTAPAAREHDVVAVGRSIATTTSRWSPCSSMTPSFAEPPTPQRFFRRPASSRGRRRPAGRRRRSWPSCRAGRRSRGGPLRGRRRRRGRGVAGIERLAAVAVVAGPDHPRIAALRHAQTLAKDRGRSGNRPGAYPPTNGLLF